VIWGIDLLGGVDWKIFYERIYREFLGIEPPEGFDSSILQ